jgi:tRNA (cmo5U34)-methyltransferase
MGVADKHEQTPPATWAEKAKVGWYLDRVGQLPPRIAGEELLRSVFPADPRSLLDLGCGDGRLAALALEARPMLSRIVALDVSPPMLERARDRFRSDHRVTVREWDMADSIASFGSFDVIVSGFAIHHLEDERSNASLPRSLTSYGQADCLPILRLSPLLPPSFTPGSLPSSVGRRTTRRTTLRSWMREAGLRQVDCLWRWRGFALLVGSGPP